jgi:hypothetical protein
MIGDEISIVNWESGPPRLLPTSILKFTSHLYSFGRLCGTNGNTKLDDP